MGWFSKFFGSKKQGYYEESRPTGMSLEMPEVVKHIPFLKLNIREVMDKNDSDFEELAKEFGIKELAEGLGIETMGGVCTYIIPIGFTIPASKSQIFSTAMDNQSEVQICLLAGDAPLAKDCRSLCKIYITGIPKAARGIPQIDISFLIDKEGFVNIYAKEVTSGKPMHLRIAN